MRTRPGCWCCPGDRGSPKDLGHYGDSPSNTPSTPQRHQQPRYPFFVRRPFPEDPNEKVSSWRVSRAPREDATAEEAVIKTIATSSILALRSRWQEVVE